MRTSDLRADAPVHAYISGGIVGVLSTYCQICGLPVQFDHYIPTGDDMYYIWRGDGDDGCEPVVAFGPEHGWLRRAVGLRLNDGHNVEPIVEGLVHDGFFEGIEDDDGCVLDGVDERAALHSACWELAQRPTSFEALELLDLPESGKPYRQQLFDFAAFVADGHGWMLVDPGDDSVEGRRSRERITALLQ